MKHQQIIFRKRNYGIPHYDNAKDPSFDKVNLHHHQYNAKAKENIDKKCKELHHNFKIGDQIFLQRGNKDSKFSQIIITMSIQL